jgi:hypothetical protein
MISQAHASSKSITDKPLAPCLFSQFEIIQQAREFLSNLTQTDYQSVVSPHFSGSAGAHMRHIIDHYLALRLGSTAGIINYNTRHRHSAIEQCPQAALQQWHEIETWLHDISTDQLQQGVTVVCEVSSQTTENANTQSTIGRELVFVSSHAIHHFSLLAVISSLQGREPQHNLGVAPSTISFLRQP